MDESLMKRCYKCGVSKNKNEFNKNRVRYDNLNNMCRMCSKEYSRKHYINNYELEIQRRKDRKQEIKEWFQNLKNTLECIICKENEPICLDFHHRDPNEKQYDISFMVHFSYSKERILKEIKKCDVLCANCHRKTEKSKLLV